MAWQIGVDVGGTFTDLLALDPDCGLFCVAKVLSTPEHQSIGPCQDNLMAGERRRG